ncbi:PREDICTED: uncharacterized protein LOC104713586 isoform X2 [Camelina sativa]|uniref:Uncharacterized protein LOC104713586 isoform X2 n=1 Tax=Camelina sativa TaxID=90675 RepID=A0ABM0TNS2_CAMSA|nr:PREDICTED: uncharacterized protein LOC104713586 isoform X2 [Camelina sativa]
MKLISILEVNLICRSKMVLKDGQVSQQNLSSHLRVSSQPREKVVLFSHCQTVAGLGLHASTTAANLSKEKVNCDVSLSFFSLAIVCCVVSEGFQYHLLLWPACVPNKQNQIRKSVNWCSCAFFPIGSETVCDGADLGFLYNGHEKRFFLLFSIV